MIDNITYQNQLIAVIVSHKFSKPGIHFFTPDELSQQLGYMHHPTGKIIPPHVHNRVSREVQYTQEVLFIRKGKLRVDFYNDQQQYLESRILEDGDTIMLVTGGHGFEVLEEIEMIEVKQGPYLGEQDKTRFVGITAEQVKVIEFSNINSGSVGMIKKPQKPREYKIRGKRNNSGVNRFDISYESDSSK
jgi:mannose-6-phosphate isomerase-like protein (cupin superfamily)